MQCSSDVIPCTRSSLYGMVVAQIYIYFITYDKDPRWLKVSVLIIGIFETMYSVCTIHWLYHLLVEGFGNLLIVDYLPWSPPTAIILEVTITIMVQSQYLRRLWILSNSNVWLISPIGILMAARFGVGMTSAAYLFRLNHISVFQNAFTPKATVEAANYIQTAVDALIAGSLIYYLRKSRTGLKRTDGTVRWIIQYVINTGLLTMAVSIGIPVTFILLQDNLAFIGLFTSIVSRLYANAFMGTLNSRHILRRKSDRAIANCKTLDYYSLYDPEPSSRVIASDLPVTSPRVPSGHSPRQLEIYTKVAHDQALAGKLASE
ncbi:hypothetical protein K474DRAFT_606205 [Panus rudis PR-1116 ss-1]|nr:hypothetical protein K474DRAFT_606205 [Panus rudis PR-1116 ss-1]